jgi:hypothetical protein
MMTFTQPRTGAATAVFGLVPDGVDTVAIDDASGHTTVAKVANNVFAASVVDPTVTHNAKATGVAARGAVPVPSK